MPLSFLFTLKMNIPLAANLFIVYFGLIAETLAKPKNIEQKRGKRNIYIEIYDDHFNGFDP